jgi:diguanylate cyclase (GGDEF)-like protein
MNSISIPDEVKNLLIDALSLTHDGIGIFNSNDTLVYCNEVLASMFSLTAQRATGMSFDSLIEHNFKHKTGLNIESDSLESWLHMAHKLRRSEKFRRFEVDYHDNRWFLVTEHTSEDDSILIFCSEITEQKRIDTRLRDLNRKLTVLAYHDSLTGIFNRRFFNERVEAEFSRSTRQKASSSLLMIDLDHFKAINDKFGHEGGDVVLVEITRQIRELLRDYDIFGRLGGEEFAVFLPDTGLPEAREIGQRIINKIKQLSFPAPVESVRLTVSIGVATIEDRHKSVDDLLRSADQLLYRAKNEGRDRVEG